MNASEWLSLNVLSIDEKSVVTAFSVLVRYLLIFDSVGSNYETIVSNDNNSNQNESICKTINFNYNLCQSLLSCKMERLSKNIFVKLNGVTIRNLSIFSKSSDASYSYNYNLKFDYRSDFDTDLTLFEFITRYNHTPFGKRLLHFWLSHPLCDLNKIKQRQKSVRLLKNIVIECDRIDAEGSVGISLENIENNEEMEDIGADSCLWMIKFRQALSNCCDLERYLRTINLKKCPPKSFLKFLKQCSELSVICLCLQLYFFGSVFLVCATIKKNITEL